MGHAGLLNFKAFIGMTKSAPPAGLIPLLAILNGNGILAATVYLPSLPSMAEALGVPGGALAYTLTAYFATYAGGQLLFGPLSDRWGRRPFLLAGMAIMAASAGACAIADSLDALIWARLVQGIGAAASVVSSRAVLSDVYERDDAARALSLVSAALALAPIIAPLIGGLIEQYVGWRANFVFSGLLTLAVLAVMFLRLPETHRPGPPQHSLFAATLGNYRSLFASRAFMAFAIVNVSIFAGLHVFNAGMPSVMIDRLDVMPATYGVLSATSGAGFFAGAMLSTWFGRRFGALRMIDFGIALLIVGAMGLALHDLCCGASVAVIVVARFVWAVGMGAALPSTVASAMELFPRARGVSSALSGFLQTASGAIGAGVVGFLPTGEALPLALVFAATAAIGLINWALNRRAAAAGLGP